MKTVSLAVLLLAPMLIGCATARIEPVYSSKAHARSSATGGAVFVSVPAGEVPIDYHGAGATQSARASRSLNDFLRETMTAELRALGYAPAATEQEAKGVLSLAFTKTYIKVNPWSGKFTAQVAVHGELKDARGAAAWSAELSGTGQASTFAPGLPGVVPQTAFNQALGAALDQFAPRFADDRAVAKLLGAAAPRVAVAMAEPQSAPQSAPASDSAPARSPRPSMPEPVEAVNAPEPPRLARREAIKLTLAEAAAELLP